MCGIDSLHFCLTVGVPTIKTGDEEGLIMAFLKDKCVGSWDVDCWFG